MTKLHGKTAVVTGGARGLGRVFARRLAELGADIAVLDIDLDAAQKFGETLDAETIDAELRLFGVRAMALQADLADHTLAHSAMDDIAGKLGRIDILVNTAGGLLTKREESFASIMPAHDLDRMLDVNLRTAINCSQAAIPHMKAAGGGSIINVSSVAALTTYSGGENTAYGLVKAALNSYTRHLAAEVGIHGIRVNAIAPGLMRTSRIRALAEQRNIGRASEAEAIPLRRLGEPEDCAGAVEFFASDMSSYITGECLAICGGSILASGNRRSATSVVADAGGAS